MIALVMENATVKNDVNVMLDLQMLIVQKSYVKIIVIIMDIVMMEYAIVKMDILELNVHLKHVHLHVILKVNVIKECAYVMRVILDLIVLIDNA